MGDLFDAAAMYDEDYLYFFAAPGDLSEFAVHGPVIPGADFPGEAAAELISTTPPIAPSWMGSFVSCGRVAGWRWTWTT